VSNILEVRKLVKDYDTYRAVDTISFDIGQGQILGLLGPNGAGKSTTIQMLMGITLPTDGDIEYFGLNFKHNRQRILQRINFASAYNTLQGRISVKENLIVFAGLYQVAKPLQKIAELLEFFEISDLSSHKYWDLSAGERTRVNLAKALLNDPELILMDEPTASLDPDIADKVLSLIETLQKSRSLSILFTSHNMQEVTRICDQVIFLDKGKIVSKDTPTNHISKLSNVTLEIRFSGDSKKLVSVLTTEEVEHSTDESNWIIIRTTKDKMGRLLALVVNSVNVLDITVDRPDLEDVFLEIARGKE
jgi:ABC-2 type transport system ATP-binding protein